jgi:DNA-binding beta-propeller fold protein YncE
MSRFTAGTFLIAVTTAAVMGPVAADPAIPNRVVTGFNSPESAVWDATTQAWYISVGAFGGEGGVMKLESDSDTPEMFATGLDGPQGVTIHEGTMYVADGNHVQVIDMADPQNQRSIPTGGGASDVDVDPGTGDVFVSDLGGGRVWRIAGGTGASTLFAQINSPDGLYVKDGGVYISNFALGGAGGIFRFDIATGARSTVVEIPGATLDGLEPDGDEWLATDFAKGHIWRATEDGDLLPVGQLLPGSADLGMDPETRTIAVPNLALNHVTLLTI